MGQVPCIGLTGSPGAGKTTALTAFERLGAATLSTDAVVHELYATPQLRDAVVARWGEDVAPAGVVDRRAVAGRVFTDAREREWLEGQLWPRVGARVREWLQGVAARDPPPVAAVVEVPLLFEAAVEEIYDATVAITADERVRAERDAGRAHIGAAARDARQLPQAEKARRATFVIDNTGTVEELERQLSTVLCRLRPS